jgi:uncharacterized protein (TIGR03435 family)
MDWRSRRIAALLEAALLATAWIGIAAQTPIPEGGVASGAASPKVNAVRSGAPSFDVATIKPHSPEGDPSSLSWIGIRNTPEGVEGALVTIQSLIQHAYGLRSKDQVSGGPEWARNERFDIQAKMSETEMAEMQKLSPTETKARREAMLQALLAERFKLKVHSETRQAPVFELMLARGGPKLKDAATDADPPLGKGEDGKPLAGFYQATGSTEVAQGESTKALADFLSQPTSGLGRPVVDKTGLNGAYDFTLNWVPHWDRVLPGGGSASPEEADSLFEALQQIGLRLQPATGPIDTIVIDHVERPTAN